MILNQIEDWNHVKFLVKDASREGKWYFITRMVLLPSERAHRTAQRLGLVILVDRPFGFVLKPTRNSL